LGGEKLKSSLPYSGIFFSVLFIFAALFCFASPLSAQTQEPLPDSGVAAADTGTAAPVQPGTDESAIILGEVPNVPAPAGGSSIFVVLRMVLVLALAALAIYGVVFFIKRLARPQESRDPHLKVLARVPLGNDSFAAVVSVGPKAWLVGGGSGGVNLISEIDDPESLETMLIDDARRTAESGARRFMDFRSLISKGKNDAPGSSHAENLRKQRERLKGL